MNNVRYKKLINVPASKSIKLNILGFGLQSIVSVEKIFEAITQLPIEHYYQLKVIKYDPNKNIAFLLRHQRTGRQLGEYLINFDSIVMYKFNSSKECLHILFHEIGHHVYFRVISSELKKRWVTKLYQLEPAVSELGKRNAAEDFAESYSLYATNKNNLAHFPLKQAFLSSLFNL